ncbi:hypothetical protein ACS0TY_006848 [Phlomoides rotata]
MIASAMANLGPDLGYLVPSSKSSPSAVMNPSPRVSALNAPPIINKFSNKNLAAHESPAVTILSPAVSALNAHPIINEFPNKDLAAHGSPNLHVEIAAPTTPLISHGSETIQLASSSRGLNPLVLPLGKGISSSTVMGTNQVVQASPAATLGCGPGAVPAVAHGQHEKSYAHIVSTAPASSPPISTDVLQAMKPVRKGLYLTVAEDEGLHKQGVLELRDSLIGRVTHARGDKPLVQADLMKKLTAIWGVQTPWSLIPIGEGYYIFQFSCGDDRERIFAKRTWQIKPGFLHLQRWVQDFNPYKVSSSVAPVWIRISELPLEYWNTNIITALASAVGTVIKLNEHTASRSMGHFARVLVELDLKQYREEYVMFERAGHRSVVYIQYERLPEFYNYCTVMGHSTGNYGTYYTSKQGKTKSAPSDPNVAPKTDPPPGGTKQWVQRTFGGAKPPDKTVTPAATLVTGSGPPPFNRVDTSAAPNVSCSNKFGALAEEGLIVEDLDLADKVTSTDASGLAATDCASEDLVSIRGLEVHLPPIMDNISLGGSPANGPDDQAQIISHPTEPQQEVQDTSMDGFEWVSGQRGKRGRGRPPVISKDYNLRNHSQGSDGSQGETAYVLGPGLVIPEDNSTRPLQAMHLVVGEKWGDVVDLAPPTYGDGSNF